MKLTVAVVGWLVCFPLLADAQKIAVHVSAGDPTAQFVDPALRDSAKDVVGYLRGKKIVKLVDSPNAATVEIRIVGRHTGASGGAVITAPMAGMAFAIPAEGMTVSAVLMVGSFKHALVATGDGSWRHAATRMASQIDRWLKENAAQLTKK